LEERVGALAELAAKLGALKTAAEKLSSAAGFFVKKASSADETVVAAAAGSSAAVGSHEVTVASLARATTLVSAAFADTDSTRVGTGILRITVGATTTEIAIDQTNNTLAGLRDAINASAAEVSAFIVNENAGGSPVYRLVVTGKKTGAANAVTVDESGLAQGEGEVAPGFTTSQSAQDASLTIDGLSIARASNTVADVLEGVTLELKSVSASPVRITVSHDTEAIQTQIEELIGAYNAVFSWIAENSQVGSEGKESGPMLGDSAVREVRRRLQSALTAPVGGSISILAQIGVTTQRDGTLAIDSGKLAEALASDLEGVSNLFLAAGGLAEALADAADDAVRTGDGLLTLRIDSEQQRIERLEEEIARRQRSLEKLEEDLIRRFAALERLVSQLQTQGQFLAQQLQALSAQRGSA
jgi:flagellar hook-associated protein 2